MAWQIAKREEKNKARQAHFSIEVCCDGWERRGEER
jgi:hypothetical protein